MLTKETDDMFALVNTDTAAMRCGEIELTSELAALEIMAGVDTTSITTATAAGSYYI